VATITVGQPAPPRLRGAGTRDPFALALLGLVSANRWMLVHGRLGGPRGQPHAWLLSQDRTHVWCPTRGRVYTREEYARRFDAFELRRYGLQPAARAVKAFGTAGPWTA
jgi:hypothetical protein